MYYLIVDIGNTRAKMAIYEDGVMASEIEAVGHEKLAEEARRVCSEKKISACMISSVASPSVGQNLSEALEEAGVAVERLTPSSPVPECLGAINPTLGADRLAAIVAAVTEFPGREILIVDAGTAVTYEYISASGQYLGGNISPGLQTRFRALNAFTSLLPVVAPTDYAGPIGFSTSSAIAAGVLDGFRYEVEGFIRSFLSRKETSEASDKKKTHKKAIILTGGDLQYLVLKVKSCIFARPNLVLDGTAFVARSAFGTHFD